MATPLRLVRALGWAALIVRRVWAPTYQRGAPGGRQSARVGSCAMTWRSACRREMACSELPVSDDSTRRTPARWLP